MRQFGASALSVQRAMLGSLVYLPTSAIGQPPSDAGMTFRELSFAADDRRRLHGWWLSTTARGRLGQILFCHRKRRQHRRLAARSARSERGWLRSVAVRLPGLRPQQLPARRAGTYRDARTLADRSYTWDGIEWELCGSSPISWMILKVSEPIEAGA
jgi:hypothetical protein